MCRKAVNQSINQFCSELFCHNALSWLSPYFNLEQMSIYVWSRDHPLLTGMAINLDEKKIYFEMEWNSWLIIYKSRKFGKKPKQPILSLISWFETSISSCSVYTFWHTGSHKLKMATAEPELPHMWLRLNRHSIGYVHVYRGWVIRRDKCEYYLTSGWVVNRRWRMAWHGKHGYSRWNFMYTSRYIETFGFAAAILHVAFQDSSASVPECFHL